MVALASVPALDLVVDFSERSELKVITRPLLYHVLHVNKRYSFQSIQHHTVHTDNEELQL